MNIQFRILWPFLLLIACNPDSTADKRVPGEAEIVASGHRFTAWFYHNQLDSLIEHIADKDYRLQNLIEFRKKVDLQLGTEVEVIKEKTGRGRRHSDSFRYYYIRYSRFTKTGRPVKTLFSFDIRNHIYQFSVEGLPVEAPSEYREYRTETELRLPFKGEWFVAAGGRDIIDNQHAVSIDQRFAYDFVIKIDGMTYRNRGSRNEDYFCFGKEILAPGSGIVVKVVNHIRENKPGEMPENAGNYLVIDHRNGEFSILAHFKYRSISVNEGDEVETGQFLGLCGNSGHSSEAHLHYHLQNTPVLFHGEGLPAQFRSYMADGKEIARGEPFWGQTVTNK
jgi:murein DD-endopeptidase MepM/ murein hydrolase activator NlpD